MCSHTPGAESSVDDAQDTGESTDGSRLMNRRNMLKSAVGTSSLFLAGCSGSAPTKESNGMQTTEDTETAGKTGTAGSDGPDFSGRTLKVADWSGQYHTYFTNTLKPMYEEETGATVELVPGWSDIISKIKAAPKDDPPYDIAVTEGIFYKQARAEGLFLELRKENIPNLEQVYPYLREFRPTDYAIPFDGAPVAVMYNNEQIDYDIDTWQTLIDENTRITMDGGFYAYTLHLAAIVADAMDGAGEMYDESQHDAVFENAEKFNAVSYYGSGAERWQQMQQRIANAAQSYFGVSMGRKEKNDYISLALPEQTTGYYDHYGVVRGTDNREMAEHFLNFMLRTDVQNAWGDTSHQLLANENAKHSKAAQRAGFPSTNDAYKDFKFPDYEKLAPHSDELSTRFEKLKS